jgi:hypothetical protein
MLTPLRKMSTSPWKNSGPRGNAALPRITIS